MGLNRISLTSALIFALALPLFCNGSESPYELLKKAQYFADLYNWRVASPLFQRAEPLLRKNGDERNALYAHIGVLRLTSTAPIAQRSDELAHLINTDGLLASDKRLRLFALTVKGDLDGEIDQFAARQDWTEVTRLANELGDAKWVYRAEGQLGFTDYYDGDLASCQRRVAAALISATEAQDVGAEIFFLSTIANGYEMQRSLLLVAIDYAKRAISLAAAHPDAGRPMVAQEALVRALADMGKVAEAKQQVEALLANPKLDYAERVDYLAAAADVATADGDNRQGIAEFEQAIRIASAVGGDREAADLESRVSDLYLKTGNLLKAEECARNALATLERSGATPLLPAKLDALAQVLIARKRYSAANSVYERAESLEDSLIGRADSVFAKTALITGADQLYAHHFGLLAEHFDDPEAAYNVVEQARGRAIADLLLSKSAVSSTALAIERHIANLRLRMASAESPTEIARLREAIFLEEQKRAVNPDLTILHTSHFRPVPLQKLQNTLNPSEVLLEYVVAEPHSYVLVLTARSRRIVKLSGRKNIENLVAGYTAAVKQNANARQQARDLYQSLLAPIPLIRSKPRYLIIPDGCLNLVPFDALRDDHDEFVVQLHTVAYEPSSTTLYLLRAADLPGKASKTMLAVGGVPYSQAASERETPQPSFAPGQNFEDLPNSLAEADIAATALRNPHNKKLEGMAATESNLKNALREGYDYVHLAVHAVSSDDPDRAALVLLSDPSRGEDGFVQASEIVQMRLQTTLVVLSACDTNVGPIQGEEGISALSTAFLLAGAKTVVSTLWPIEDTSSLALMRAFYHHLAAGQPVADALAAAKRDLLTTYGKNNSPIHWAAFIVQGSESQVFRRRAVALTAAASRK